jgi:hypothetical protein
LPAGYDRRKYVWKLLYIYMLGYNIEFGHKQAADLIPQAKCVPATPRASHNQQQFCTALPAARLSLRDAAAALGRRYKDKQVGYMACSLLLREVRADQRDQRCLRSMCGRSVCFGAVRRAGRARVHTRPDIRLSLLACTGRVAE